MDMTLNEEQKAAVLHDGGPALVFAGAGSGKTRVLTYRIAHLIKNNNVRPHNILAVTFTNKAAREMKTRIAELLGMDSKSLWAGTFHGTCVKILREFGELIGINRRFVIFDDYDQKQVIRRCMDDLGIEQKRFHPNRVLNLISRAKEQLIPPEEFGKHFSGTFEGAVESIYNKYQETLANNRALDFDDLIMQAVVLLRTKPEVLAHYQDRFHHILVDEYQDINKSQYEFVKALSRKHNNLFCVGDDDQSIYRWRGSDIGFILQFENDFPDAKVYKMEQNYRCTKLILEAAHHVVKDNKGRVDKKLWTDNDQGENITLLESVNDLEEANNIAKSIVERANRDNRSFADFVVLYRTNAQSRVFEEAMINTRVPYKLIGSLRFYERKEIKDILAYMRLASNPYDTVSLARVINVPARGIGQTSWEKLLDFADQNGLTVFDGLLHIEEAVELTKRAREAMAKFALTIAHFHEMSTEVDVHRLTKEILDVSGYMAALKEENTMEAQARLENVREMLNVTEQFCQTGEDTSLTAYLEQVALISDIDTYNENEEAVTLMTLHAAKGLEFPIVYITGLEEGTFPHRRSFEEREELEEERRLCYVGMTRAQKELVLSYALQRMNMGTVQSLDVSRFVLDVPPELMGRTERPSRERGKLTEWKNNARRPVHKKTTPSTYRAGQKVVHQEFGTGIVLNTTGEDEKEQVTIAFDSEGIKKLMVKYANLQAR